MKHLLILLFFFSVVINVNGQHISGKILNEDMQAIPDSYILHLKTGNHIHSSDFGYFNIKNISVGDTLRIQSLGYEIQNIIINSSNINNELVITLKSKPVDIDEVVIHDKNKVLNVFANIDIVRNPVNSSQEVLRTVPGLIIGQHAGGGKAEQIFLRGFDNDHGTDINITVDGIPVNLVSHAHGQGYADLHFLIPEIIEKIDYGKGPYFSDKGNFCTTGYVDFKTKNVINEELISVEYGQFNTFRNVLLLNVLKQKQQNLYVASEILLSDGAFESPQNFNRLNLTAKYNFSQKNNFFSILFSYFQSKWNASGQIPQRAVDNGFISRFGSIDDTEGGITGRTNLMMDYSKLIKEDLYIKNKLFYSKYNFELYSNFTFFLNDSINGDQIKQKEFRELFGGQTELSKTVKTSNYDLNLTNSFGFLINKINDDELSHTLERQFVLNKIAFGDINETDLYAFSNIEFDFNKLLINPAIRLDYFIFDYTDKTDSLYNNKTTRAYVPQPKLNLVYNFNNKYQLFLKTGIGFHSNDTRVSITEYYKKTLPKAFGTDIGGILKLSKKIILNTALWYLFLEQEFVYVGDEAVVEPSGKTKRFGADLGLRVQFNNYIYLKSDITYSYAKGIEEPEGLNYIPLAPVITGTGGIFMHEFKGFSSGVQFRYLSDRPANESYTITAKGYTIIDLNFNYSLKNIDFGISIENLFNTEWNETQFATETRLFNETESVEEIHFIPGTPFFLKGKITYRF